MNRAELQRLAGERLLDAKALLDAGRWTGAYYLAGYAVECGLKSCVLAYVDRTGVIFKERKYLRSLEEVWTHDLERLVQLAGLEPALGTAIAANVALGGHWAISQAWTEASRYEQKTEAQARALYEAITHQPDGFLPWIQTHW